MTDRITEVLQELALSAPHCPQADALARRLTSASADAALVLSDFIERTPQAATEPAFRSLLIATQRNLESALNAAEQWAQQQRGQHD